MTTPVANSHNSTPIQELPNLPDELFLAIFEYLNPPDLFLSRSVSKEWRRLASDEKLWKTFAKRLNIPFDGQTDLTAIWIFSEKHLISRIEKIVNSLEKGSSCLFQCHFPGVGKQKLGIEISFGRKINRYETAIPVTTYYWSIFNKSLDWSYFKHNFKTACNHYSFNIYGEIPDGYIDDFCSFYGGIQALIEKRADELFPSDKSEMLKLQRSYCYL